MAGEEESKTSLERQAKILDSVRPSWPRKKVGSYSECYGKLLEAIKPKNDII